MENAYTDRDVRENPDLEAIAEEYVRGYTGSFLFILDCRQRLNDGYRLGTAHVRTVLNTMRADVRVRELPSVLRVTTIQPTQADDAEVFMPRWYVDHRRVRPPYIRLPVTWHHDFGMSTHRRAETIHKICHFKCSVTYYPHMTQNQFHDRFKMRIVWACGSSLPGIEYNRNSKQYTEEWPIRLLTTDEATELLETCAKRLCPQCARHV